MKVKTIICGPGSSGKDYLKKRYTEKGFKSSISYTTRPPRDGEIDGVEYHFVSDSEFMDMVKNDLFIEWQKFPTKINGRDIVAMYGTSVDAFESCDIFIMTPSGINDLNEEHRKTSMIIYLDIDESVRRSRLSERRGAEDVETRLKNDRADFESFTDYDLRITDPNF